MKSTADRAKRDKFTQICLINFVFVICRFFNGQSGAFTLLEATPEFLKISQIDDNGKEVYRAKLKPRTSSRSLSDAENTILDEFFTSQT